MIKSEKRMETVVKSIADLQKKIKADSERLKKLQTEYEELRCGRLSAIWKKRVSRSMIWRCFSAIPKKTIQKKA